MIGKCYFFCFTKFLSTYFNFLDESAKFLFNISKRRPSFKFVSTVDCGSGIGRIAQNLLVPLFEKVDIVEQSVKLITVARENLESNPKMGVFYCEGLQSW